MLIILLMLISSLLVALDHIYTNNLKNRFLTSSALPQNFRLHSRLAYQQWSLAPDENSEEPPCQTPDSSSCLCIQSLLSEEADVVIATKRIELEGFPNTFNPSILKFDRGFILSFRYCPDLFFLHHISYIGIVLLDEEFNPISETQLVDTRLKSEKTPSQSEDARLFFYRGRIFLLYNDNIDIVCPNKSDSRDMFMIELFYKDNRFVFSAPLKLFCQEKSSQFCQKNWVPFEWDKTLFLGYTISPHEILCPNLATGECYSVYKTEAPLKWNLGLLKGGTPALLEDGEYLAFFHSAAVEYLPPFEESGYWYYFMGAYTFSAKPPFQITKMTSHPIVGKGFYAPSVNGPKKVIFPGSFVVSDSHIYVAYGRDDSEMWIATLDKKKFRELLWPVGAHP
jgi:predicted GH43/DUF377 family glycosyl hydrolase